MIDRALQPVPPTLTVDTPQSAGRPRSTLLRFKPIPFGKYYLLDRVNTGGMAEVFRAKAFGVEGFERIVAVKRILPSIAADTDFITMFIDEAKLAVQLNHANIAQIFDLGKVADSYFIALEYVHGKDLRAVFDQARSRARQVPVDLACYVIMKISEGLDYAHRKRDASGRELQLVHRDVSPQNMLISFDGDVKLIDFGIAKAAGQASRTRAGILKGKFGYLSPEQVEGEQVDQRSDIFGIGIVLYELLTGERLFVGDSDFSTIEKVRTLEIPSPRQLNPQIPKALERVVLKALSRNRDTRYQTALDLHDALQSVLHERTKRGQAFGRKELSAWMLGQFPEEAARDPEAIGDLEGAESLASSSTDVTPIVEPAESNAVYKETRDLPEEAKNKHPSTILGMPAVLPPADLAAPMPGRASVPPPPPRGGMNAGRASSTRPPPPPSPSFGRSVPPPQPRSQPPIASERTPDPRTISAFPSPVAQSSVPQSRSVPPPPPGASSTLPGSVQARGPSLNMDWDDEELSTQIYDRPEEASDYLYESAEGGFDELAALRVSQLAGDYGQQGHGSAPPPPPRSQSYAPNSYAAQSYGQPAQRPQTYPPQAQGGQPQYGLATQSPQSYEVP
ncbi:MAG: serine/threonine protein kinase, partial [Myxococcaceae bacterium]|nr:serine/threonine protein kinase [Myxococcaceae bacterium]